MVGAGILARLLLETKDYAIVIIIFVCGIIYLLEMILFKDPLILFFLHKKDKKQ